MKSHEMMRCDMFHHITKYECFLLHGILVVEFRSCYIFKNFTVPPKGLTRALMPHRP